MSLWRYEDCLGDPPLRWIGPILWVRGEAGFRREAGGGGVMDLTGQRRCLAEWCELLELPYNATLGRLHSGWSVTQAFTAGG